MAKRIRSKMKRGLKDFDPQLLAEECMLEEDTLKSEPKASYSFLSKFVLEDKLRKEKAGGAKHLDLEVK